MTVNKRLPRGLLAAGCIAAIGCTCAATDSLEHALRFNVDRAGYLSQFDPIFNRPILDGGSAVPVGNGDLAAVVWQPDDLTVMLNKCDIGGTTQAVRLRFVTPHKLAQRVGLLRTRLSLHTAMARVTYVGGKLPECAGWMWRGKSGKAPTPTDADMGTVEASCYVPDGRNVLVLSYEEDAKVAHPLTVSFERWVQEPFGDGVQATVVDRALVIAYTMKDGADAVDYAAALAFDGFQGATLEVKDLLRATLDVPAADRISGRIAVAVVTANEAEDVQQAALNLARETLRADATVLRRQHQAYWTSFWNRFFVDAGHPYLTALYHMALYELGVTSRGARAVKFNGALNLWNEAYRTWGAPFWCHNQTAVYLPVYAANHVELADNFHDWIARVRPEAAKAAQKFLGVDGAYYPEVMAHDFEVKDPGIPGQLSGTQWILSSGVRYALLLWNRYQYTLDEAFLREKAYPVIRDCAEFYVNYGKPGADGRYHVGPAMSWEEPPVGTDTHADCAAWRAIFPIAIECAQKLDLDAERLPVWQDRVDKAPPYPTNDGLFSVVTRDNGTAAPTDHFQWQLPNLSSVFPYSVIGIGSDSDLKRTAEDTFNRFRYNADAGHEFLPVIAARLGNAEWWRSAMFNYVQFFQLYDQGLFHYYNTYGSKVKESGDHAGLHPYLEASGIMATAVNEMLLQSHDGVIRVFPAVPERWPARFMLRAAGSLLVASEHRGRDGIPYVAIQPQAGASRTCRIALPWEDGADIVSQGRRRSLRTRDGIAAFKADPDIVYILTPRGHPPDTVPVVNISVETQYSPCRLGNVWLGAKDGANNHTSTFPLW